MPAADTAKLIASLTLQDKGFTKGLTDAEKKLGNFESTAFRVGQNIGQGIKTTASNLAKLGTIGAVGAIGLLAKSVSEASDLNEQISKSEAVFGDASAAVLAFSKTAASSLGLSQSEALEAAGALGNMFKTVGLTSDESAKFSERLVTLAADMASFNNEDPTEMLDKIRAGLSGEAEPLRRFGVLLSEAAVKQEAYATGIAETGEELTEQQKVQARYSLILKQTAVQQGDFARTSGGLANQQRILRATLKDTGATIGTALLPKITQIAVKINKLIKDNGPAIQDFANQLPGAFDKALAFAEKVPWEAIGQGLKTSAEFAGKLFDVFANLPPEVQTTLIALAGLNKLSGGAVTGIVSELGKGLIKGVLGMNAGVVNIKAGVVNGGGGGPAAGGKAFGGLGAAAVGVAGAGVVILGISQKAAADLTTSIAGPIAGAVQQNVGGGPVNIFGPFERLMRALNGDLRSPLEMVESNTERMVGKLDRNDQNAATRQNAAIAAELAAERAAKDAAYSNAERIRTQGMRDAAQAVAATVGVAGAVRGTTAAINAKDLSVTVENHNRITTNVSVRETIDGQTTFKQYQRFIS